MSSVTENTKLIHKIMDMSDNNNWDLEATINMGGRERSEILEILKIFDNFVLTGEEWVDAVHYAFTIKDKRIKFEKDTDTNTVSSDTRLNVVKPEHTYYWDQYQELLENTLGMDAACRIEASCMNILSRLSLDNSRYDNRPIKGLIHGSVQSGKTANMEGLISLASDYGFNVFVVFTGTISLLNDQTKNRFSQDLSGRYQFNIINTDTTLQMLNPESKNVIISMKTKNRIKRITKCLTSCKQSAKKYKILIIDDEADYASVDSSSTKNRTQTNKQIMGLINGKKVNGDPVEEYYGAMNYVAFTATPYANLLNESTKESLYPHDFIVSLPTSDRYFGPQQTFGCHSTNLDYDGLPIINTSYDLDDNFKKFEKEDGIEPPEELKESLAWFISAVAALRVQGYKSPLTMMINTNHITEPHKHVANAIVDYLWDKKEEVIKYCEIVYERECEKFTKDNLRYYYPDYYGDQYDDHVQEIIDYPEFERILPEIKILLSDKCKHIHGTDLEPEYHKSLHICIENSKNDKVEQEVSVIPRIRYPQATDECPDAPAFIIIGGNVLSRGVTLKGLISTFFLRPIKQADTLMQMGRWFGYRPGYELYPRIWMSNYSRKDFEYLAELDEELKEEIQRCNSEHKTPGEFAIRLRAVPKAQEMKGRLATLTSRNKQKHIIKSDVSYIGKYEEFKIFRDLPEQLNGNIDVTRTFLNSLKNIGIDAEYPELPEEKGWNVYRWRNVPSELLFDEFIMKFHEGLEENGSNKNSLQMFRKWMKNAIDNKILKNWTILLAGTEKETDPSPFTINEEVSIGRIQRGKEIHLDENVIEVRTLRNRIDLFKDVFPHEFQYKPILTQIKNGNFNKALREKERETEGLEDVPLLIIYCIDKESKARKPKDGKKSYKVDMNACQDIVSFLVEIPNIDTRDSDRVQIDLDVTDMMNEGEEDQ